MEAGTSGIRIELAAPRDAGAVADIHASRIREGFLSSLGTGFLSVLYGAMAEAPDARLLVARAEDGRVAGFVSGSASPAEFAAWFRERYGTRAALKILPRLWRPSVVRGVIETRRQAGGGGAADGPELFSIAVAVSAMRSGTGSALEESLESALRNKGATSLGAIVEESNGPARAFYERRGFKAAGSLQVHRGVRSIRYEKPI